MQTKTITPTFTHIRRFSTLLIFTLGCFWMVACSARADTGQTVPLDQARSGTLLFRTETPGQFIPAPMLATDVQLDVTGPVIRARLTQKFTNTSNKWVEGLYVFPLPDEAAVDRLVMLVGGRVIEGKIQEKNQARATYETAKAAGKKAALVEQERPNMFTNSVANIGPGETIVIQIEYQSKARLQDGQYSLHFPLVVAPRFSPTATQEPIGELVENAPLPTVTLTVNLQAGFAVQEIASPSHQITIHEDTIKLSGPVPADKDFILNWTPKFGTGPLVSLYSEELDGETYVLAMLQAPSGMGDTMARLPREMVYVIDNSGSMAGPSIRQARKALLQGLETLQSDDRFNVIIFDDETELLFTNSVPATPQNLAHAKIRIAKLDGDGGTVMLPALQAALQNQSSSSSLLRQVVFITDGQISNEDELFAEIAANLGASRLFVIGIGSAPNRYFVSRAARLGRGADLVVSDIEAVESKMTAMFRKLERPVMRDLMANFSNANNAEIWPSPVPDLYAGEPVLLLAKLPNAEDSLELAGNLGIGNWSANLDLTTATKGSGIAILWARAKIRSLEEGRFTGVATREIDRQILATALKYHLVSRLTSLVAVDVTPTRPTGADITTTPIPLAIPEGWGDLTAGIARSPAPLSVSSSRSRHVSLPATASPHQVQLILGLLLFALGLALSGRLLNRRRLS